MSTTRYYQPSLAGGEISPELYGRVDIDKYPISLRRCRNFFVHRSGGVSNRPGLEFLGEVLDSAYSPSFIPFRFNNTTQVCLLEFGEKTMRIWYQGGLIVNDEGNPVVIETVYTAEEASQIDHAQSGDVVYLAHTNHPPQKLARYSWTEWKFTPLTFLPNISTEGLALNVTGSTNEPVGNRDEITYVATVFDSTTGEESLPFGRTWVSGPPSTNWTVNQLISIGVTGAQAGKVYTIYKSINRGPFGYIAEVTASPNAFCIDRNITPDISRTPPDGNNPFSGEDKYPSVVSIHQQRLVFGRTKEKPNGLWFSRSGFYENMSRSSPPRDDDSIEVVIGSGEINEIRGLISVRDLIVLTSGSENVINGGGVGTVITPSSIAIQPQSYWGSGPIPPLVSGNTVLFIQGIGSAVRDLGYDYAVDGFLGNDRSILARHFLEGYSIKRWAYAQTPESTFWFVRNDGVLLGLSYFREQEIGAWFLYDTDGFIETVSTIEGPDRHEVYVIVRRTINGVDKRYVERFASRQVNTILQSRFLDSFLHYSGEAKRTFSGLDHLEGRLVLALADGSPSGYHTVTGGSVTLEREASEVTIGLPYHERSYIATLDIDLGNVPGMGSVLGRKKTLTQTVLRLYNSREFRCGAWQQDNDAIPTGLIDPQLPLVESKTYQHYWNEPIEVTSGVVEKRLNLDWTTSGAVAIQPAGPLPLTVLAVALDLDVGEIG